jgi:hypothetical protein
MDFVSQLIYAFSVKMPSALRHLTVVLWLSGGGLHPPGEIETVIAFAVRYPFDMLRAVSPSTVLGTVS